MLIVCPNCQTYYTVDRRGFEPHGRTVRCHNCGNSWRQGLVPENSVPPAMQQAAAQPAPAPQPYPPQTYAPYPAQQPVTAAPEPTPAPPPPPRPMDDDDVVEPDFDLPDPDEEDDLEDDIAANIDELFGEDDDEDIAAQEPESESEDDFGIDSNENENDDLTDEDIDSLFDDDEETGISSMFESGGSDDDGINDLDEIPEPDPLPESLTGGLDDEDDAPVGRMPRRKQPKKKGKGGLIAFIVILLLLIGLGAGGFFFRTLIAETIPESKILYDMIGLETGVLGDGLEIQNVQSARATEAGIDMLMVSGRIANVIDKPAPVPLIQAILLDADGVELQTVVQEPSQTELSPGNQIEFSIRIDEPSPLSRRMEVTFAPRGDGH